MLTNNLKADDHVIHIVSTESKGKVFEVVRTFGGPMASAVWFADGQGGHWLVAGGHNGLLRLVYVKLDGRKVRCDYAPYVLPNAHATQAIRAGRNCTPHSRR